MLLRQDVELSFLNVFFLLELFIGCMLAAGLGACDSRSRIIRKIGF